MSEKYYPSIKNSVVICILFTVFSLVFGVLVGVVVGVVSVFSESDLILSIGIIIANLLAYLVVFKMILNRMEIKKSELFNSNYLTPKMLITFTVMMLGFVIISSQIDIFINRLLPMSQFLVDLFNDTANSEYFVISIITLIVIPVIFEELMFRGFILKGLIKNYSPKTAIIVSALLFGLIHLNPWQFVTAFLLGLIFAWIALKTKSIIFPMLGHLINNLIATLAMRFPDSDIWKLFNMDVEGELVNLPLEINLIGVALFIIGFYIIYTQLKNVSLKPIEEPQVDDITA